ncbi:hypothetical protein [Kitasatospora indigofera]|uniref:hypothetical protein n=1 Tax=Kitasatospora indigofera TaxID=67307 RepID=UPI0036C54C1A
MKNPAPDRPAGAGPVRRPHLAADRVRLVGLVLAAALLTAACGAGTRTPSSQDARLTKAAGVASISLIMPEGLWKETRGYDMDHIKGDKLDGDRGARGLVRVNLTGTQVVTYMKQLDKNSHPGWMSGATGSKQSALRVYGALGAALDTIKAARGAGDPNPEVLIDDTLATPAP